MAVRLGDLVDSLLAGAGRIQALESCLRGVGPPASRRPAWVPRQFAALAALVDREAGEVEEVLQLSLKELRDGYGRRRLVRRCLPIRTDTYVVGDHLIWGATARILTDLVDRLELLETA